MLQAIDGLRAEHGRDVSALEVGDQLGFDDVQVSISLAALVSQRLVDRPLGLGTTGVPHPPTTGPLRLTARGRALLAWGPVRPPTTSRAGFN
jgi:hypothetical protein